MSSVTIYYLTADYADGAGDIRGRVILKNHGYFLDKDLAENVAKEDADPECFWNTPSNIIIKSHNVPESVIYKPIDGMEFYDKEKVETEREKRRCKVCQTMVKYGKYHQHCGITECNRVDYHSHCPICRQLNDSEYHQHCLVCDRVDFHTHCVVCKKIKCKCPNRTVAYSKYHYTFPKKDMKPLKLPV